MATILAFAGSNSSTSINFQLVKYTASVVGDQAVQLLNMAYFPFPMYSIDHEREKGFSNSLVELKNDISKADGLIISVNEHNGNMSAYFKNLLDWLSRLERKFLLDKVVLLMSTSGGKRGGLGALEIAEKTLVRFGASEVLTFSLPNFKDNFDKSKGIVNEGVAKLHQEKIAEFLSKIKA
ncbi:NADPH-dependent FMN reductase [Ulvibacterium marinum]|uniref:NADPH-dependent oxidoreductase n=1 Tax=Ulvibacterium marinum TaxID=2419782 RepID=A0A3B0C9Q3_9FLAO|nr:NAD(P)H-dependent oxidoreductase [Ulvibacterium marinum]RKN81328.1 NADPH-dependent oxidoreductase [Ulvibacterium marinum]